MKQVRRLLLEWYARFGRAHLPWRRTRDPYRILVSEFMLQQTQVDRVIPKYQAFIRRFPDVRTLAAASTADALREWKGLGYNSRAVRLKQIAQAVCERFEGRIPADRPTLRSLNGIGEYTASALRTFAFGADDAAIDTNVRRVVHRLLYGIEHPPAVSQSQIDERARAFVPPGYGHEWNSAMMDLGATMCTARAPKCLLCPLAEVCRAYPVDALSLERARAGSARKASPQESLPFHRTTRFVRGRIIDRLRELPPGKRISFLDLHRDLRTAVDRSAEEVRAVVAALERDGLVEVHRKSVSLKSG